ncbi:MAG: hypothetical protein G01um10145_888 [Microgenomates group bacterium Gr01-1014_5]|nr:MAG: hypothetical protein G01um10145_888 [Microgenomates group bacterium Gr01-1014_5]
MVNIGSFRNAVFFLCYLFFNPRLGVLALKGLYLPVYIQFEWLKNYNVATVIDVGASSGKVTHVLHSIFPNAKIYSFEPIRSESDKIRRSENVTVENVALSNKSGAATFYQSHYSPTSSLLIPLQKIHTEKITVQTITLDSYFKNIKLEEPVLLKIDTQGTEKLILKGGENLLKRVSIIHIETSFASLYKNQSLFKEVYELLVKAGFEYSGSDNEAQIYPVFGPSQTTNSIFFKE